jgi:hypothetical protein
MLQNNRDPEDDNLLLNEILRRRDLRALPCVKRNWKSYKIAHQWGMYNDSGPSQAKRDLVPLDNTPLDAPRRPGEFVPRQPLPPLLDTTILRVCKQTNEEATSMIYSNKTISLIVQSDGPHLECMERCFGDYIEFNEIRNLRLELQTYGGRFSRYKSHGRATPHFSLTNMPLLQKLQVLVTSPLTSGRTLDEVRTLERDLKHLAVDRGTGSTGPLEELVLAVSKLPPKVKVVWGLSGEEEVAWDIGGVTLLKQAMLWKLRDAFLTFYKAFLEEKAKAQSKGPPAAEVTED